MADHHKFKAKNGLLVKGANDNSGKADFALNTGGNATVSLHGTQVQMGSSDMNWNGKISYISGSGVYLSAWDNDLRLTTSGGASASARNIRFAPQASGGSSTERMIITGAGKVGIGTSSPVYKFEVSDGARTGVFNPNSTLDGFFIGTYQNKPLIFGTNDTQRMRLTASGNLGIGTTSPSEKLTVSGNIQAENATFTGTGDVTVKIIADTDNVTETDNPTLGFGQDGNTTGTLFVIGLEGNPNTVFPGSIVNAPYIHGNVSAAPLQIGNKGKLVADFDSTATNPALTITKFSNISGTNGSTILNLKNYMGSSATNGDLSQQKSFIDFQLLDANTNEVPQVRIGAEVGRNADANSQMLEGSGAFVVYTNNAESTSGDAGASLTEKLRVDYQGNVGIGTSSPSAALHVTDGGTSGETTFSANGRITMSGDGVLNWGAAADYGTLTWDTGRASIYAKSGKDLWLGAHDTQGRVRIDSAGRLNIVNNALLIESTTALDKSGNYMVMYDGSGAAAIYAGNTSDNRNYYQSDNHRWRSDNSSTNFAELSATGLHVGGISSPTAKLTVSGNVNFNVADLYANATQAHLNFGRSSAQRFNMYVTDAAGYIRYYQDETDGTDHSVHFEIQSSSTGTNKFYFNKSVDVTGTLALSNTTVIDSNSFRGREFVRHYDSGNIVMDMTNNTYTMFKNPLGETRLWLGSTGYSGATSDNSNYYNGSTHFFRNTGSTELARISASGVDAKSGGFLINGTNVINSSRNIHNVGTISSGAITSSGIVSGTAFVGGLYAGATGAPDARIWAVSADYPNYGIFYNEGNPDTIEFKWNNVVKAYINMETGLIDSDTGFSVGGTTVINSSGQYTGGLNPSSLSIGGTTVIDSSRNGTFSGLQGVRLGVNNTSSSTKQGIALYGGYGSATNPTYGIMFTGTSGSGTHGFVTGDWATYFTMDGTANRGWIFRNQSNTSNVASISNSGKATFTEIQTYTTDGASNTNKINLGRGGAITFYGNANHSHAIMGRNASGSVSDNIRINSYAGVFINLDSNSNNTSNADFIIGRHGSGTGTMSTLFTVGGENGNLTLTGDINLPTAGRIYFGGTTNFGVGVGGHNNRSVYVDTVESGTSSDALELVYYQGSSVKIGPGVGTKPLYAGSYHVDGKKFIDMPSNSGERGPWNPIVSSIRGSGRMLYTDEDFTDGTNSVNVYNNSGGGTVTITREDATTSSGGNAPNSSGKVLKIYWNGGTASPNRGGFYQSIPSEDNHTFVQVFQAKLPVGATLYINENSQGTNNTSYFLTDNIGTGKWEWYARISHCGQSGTFSSGGHISVGGPSSAFSWYLASCTCFDITETPKLWSAWNDGTGSGLDADLLDGQQGSSYLRSNADDSYDGDLTLNGMIFKDDSNTTRNLKIQGPSGTDVGISGFTSSGQHAFQLYGTNGSTYGFLDGNWGNWDLQITKNGGLTKRVSGSTATIWHSANDGAGSGLDADNLDGTTWATRNKVVGATNIEIDAANFNGIKFWNGSSNYRISMAAAGVSGAGRVAQDTSSDYNMYFKMDGGTDRGFVFQEGTTNTFGIDGGGHVRAISTISSNNRQAMNCAHWSNSGTSTGAIKITLPGAPGSVHSMPIIEVHTYDYSSKAHVIYRISGHNWSTGSNWYNNRVTAEGGPPLAVRLGHDGSNYCIIIGDTNTSWSYGHVTVNLLAHPSFYQNNQNFTEGWGASQITSLPSNVTAQTVGKIWHSANDGSGSGLDADTVDGVQASALTKTTATTTQNMNNFDITGVNRLTFNDPGVTEGIKWNGGNQWQIYESPDNQSNASGNLQFASGSGNGTRRLTLDTSGNLNMVTGNLRRSAHNIGHLEGGHNNIGSTAAQTSPIYTIGSSYNPTATALQNMYGIGFGHTGNGSFLTGVSALTQGSSGWGQYVASDGDARIFLNAEAGTVLSTGQHYAAGSLVWNAGNDGAGSGLDADLLDGQQGSYYARYDHFRSLGTTAFTGTSTTAGYISEMESDGAFDSYSSAFKTSWSYAGNFNISDAGSYGPTETAGMAHLCWTDNSSNTTRGNITVLAIAPNTGGSGGRTFIYNDQGSTYSPGWREIWTSRRMGAGTGLDADLLDGQQGSYYAAASSIPTNNNQLTNGAGYQTTSGNVRALNTYQGSANSNSLQYWQASGQNTDYAPDGSWYNTIRGGHGNPHTYYSNTLAIKMTGTGVGTIYTQALSNGTFQGWNKHWHANNDGSGSGLDADTVDGVHESSFMRRSANSHLDMNGYNIQDCNNIENVNVIYTRGANKDVKFAVWNDTTNYGVGMTSGVTLGHLNDYAMTFCMNNDSDRGFWWGYSGQSKSAGAMSLTTNGKLWISSNVTVPEIFINRQSNASSGISWYSSSYKAWATYMAPTGANHGPTGNITAPSGSLVTSWALRNFIENNGGYGWTFESGTAYGQPSVVAEIRSSDGSAVFNGWVRSGNGTASSPSHSFKDDTDCGMFRIGSNAVGFSTGGTQRFKINSNGLLLTGTSGLWVNGARVIDNARSIANVINYENTDGHMQLHRTANAPLILNRMGSTGSSGTSNGEILNFKTAGTKRANIGYNLPYGSRFHIGFNSGSFGLQFYNFSSAMYIAPSQADGSNKDNLVDLGSSGSRFDDVYATNGTIQTSDRNEKQDIQALTDAETRVATACKGLIRRFRWVDSVQTKGDDARYHFGAIAQDVEDAFTAEGLNAGDYALFIKNHWWEHEGTSYPTAEEAPAGAVEKVRRGIRYNQLLAFIISAL